tara:strand:- start:911 stop:1228 length:318 start_codon:yes stop_codon:yes gene_type:complete
MTTLQALKSIQDIEIIISPKNYNEDQEIIYISDKNLNILTNNGNISFEKFINSKDFFDIYNTLTGLKMKDIAKFSCCLLNVKDFDQIQNTLFGKTIIETNGKYYN